MKTICRKGNDRSHTKVRKVATEEEYNKVVESLFNLYGYLFYEFFKQHRFGSNREIMSVFSLLPPIVRYITLKGLYEIDSENSDVIDKYAMATLKAINKSTALEWIEINKNKFIEMSSMTENGKKDVVAQLGSELGRIVIDSAPDMYHLCLQRIEQVDMSMKGKILYDTFETALRGYKEYGHVDGDTEEMAEFNHLMEFVFMGRKEQEYKISTELADDLLIEKVTWLFFPEKMYSGG